MFVDGGVSITQALKAQGVNLKANYLVGLSDRRARLIRPCATMCASADRQVLPTVIQRGTVHVVLPRWADHDVALVDDDAFAFKLNEALT